MKLAIIAALLLAFAAPVPAQDRTVDEKAIRDSINKINAGKAGDIERTADSVFWSGALVRPIVGNEKPEIRPGSSAGDKRTNARITATVKQIKASQSGDMAYEYSTTRNSWDGTDNKKHIEFDCGTAARVAEGGWKVEDCSFVPAPD